MGDMRGEAVELLNQAMLADGNKIEFLSTLKELVLYRDPSLLEEFVTPIMELQQDKFAATRKFIASFIEELLKKEMKYLPQVSITMSLLTEDLVPGVLKQIISTFNTLFANIMNFMIEHEECKTMFENMTVQVRNVQNAVVHKNDGVRMHALKFVENYIISMSPTESNEWDGFSLRRIPPDHPVLMPADLARGATTMLEGYCERLKHPKITNTNVSIIVNGLAKIGALRPCHMDLIVSTLCALPSSPPPSLKESHKKGFAITLQAALKRLLQASTETHHEDSLFDALVSLGFSDQAEKLLSRRRPQPKPAPREYVRGKRPREEKGEEPSAKRQKIVPDPAVTPSSDAVTATGKMDAQDVDQSVLDAAMQAVLSAGGDPDKIAQNLAAKGLNIANLLGIVQNAAVALGGGDALASISGGAASSSLPSGQPGGASSTPTQDPPAKRRDPRRRDPRMSRQAEVIVSVPGKKWPEAMVISTLDEGARETAFNEAFERIVKNDEFFPVHCAAASVRRKLLAHLLATRVSAAKAETFCKDPVVTSVLIHCCDDLLTRYGLALTCLHAIFAREMMGRSEQSSGLNDNPPCYTSFLLEVLRAMVARLPPGDKQADKLVVQFVVNCPSVPTETLEVIRGYCEDKDRVGLGLTILKTLVLQRPAQRGAFLSVILIYTSFPDENIRTPAIRLIANHLHADPLLAEAIELHAQHDLITMGNTFHEDKEYDEEEEERAHIGLYLYFALCTKKHELLQGLAKFYVGASEFVKKTIHRNMGMLISSVGTSPTMLALITNFPPGSESLIYAIIHVLADKSPDHRASDELLAAVRTLVGSSKNPRFLVPIVASLPKKEVQKALPGILTLKSNFIKTAIQSLLKPPSRLTPVELMMSLHTLDKEVSPAIVKATDVCFGRRDVFKDNVLAIVLQKLVERNPLPPLTMRTVIKTWTICPKLTSLVKRILTRLIERKIWTNTLLWNGFVKCCQLLKQNSFSVIVQLESEPLAQLLAKTDMTAALKDYVAKSKSRIPRSTLDLLEGKKKPEKPPTIDVDAIEVEMTSGEGRKTPEQAQSTPEQARTPSAESPGGDDKDDAVPMNT